MKRETIAAALSIARDALKIAANAIVAGFAAFGAFVAVGFYELTAPVTLTLDAGDLGAFRQLFWSGALVYLGLRFVLHVRGYRIAPGNDPRP